MPGACSCVTLCPVVHAATSLPADGFFVSLCVPVSTRRTSRPSGAQAKLMPSPTSLSAPRATRPGHPRSSHAASVSRRQAAATPLLALLPSVSARVASPREKCVLGRNLPQYHGHCVGGLASLSGLTSLRWPPGPHTPASVLPAVP